MTSSSPIRWLTGLTCFLGVSVLGVLLGGILATRVLVEMSPNGVDQIATALGGAMVGGIIGVIVGVLLALRLKSRGHLLVATVALLAAVGTLMIAMSWQPRVGP